MKTLILLILAILSLTQQKEVCSINTNNDGIRLSYYVSGTINVTADSLIIELTNAPREAYKITKQQAFSTNTQYWLEVGYIANLYPNALLLNKVPRGNTKRIDYVSYNFCEPKA